LSSIIRNKAILIAGVLVHQQIVKIKTVFTIIVLHHPHLLLSTSSSLSTSGKRKDSEGKRSSEATLKLAAINRSFFTVAQPEIICPANCSSMNGNCIKHRER
jgi:hypothetical protein